LNADWYDRMNVNIAPFNNLKGPSGRQLRPEQELARSLYGGKELAVPTCTILRRLSPVLAVLRLQLQ